MPLYLYMVSIRLCRKIILPRHMDFCKSFMKIFCGEGQKSTEPRAAACIFKTDMLY